MTKGTYVVGESVGPSKDGSFRSMLCAMLVFFAICLILILAAWPWSKGVQERDPKDDIDIIDDNSDNKYEKLIQDKDRTTTTTTTRKPRITKLTTRPPLIIPHDSTTTQVSKEPELEKTDSDEDGEDVDLPPKTTTTTTTTTTPKTVAPTTTTTTTTTTTPPPLPLLPPTTSAPAKPLIPIDTDTSEEPSTTTEIQYSKDTQSTSVTSTDIPSTTERIDAEFSTWSTTEDSITQNPLELTSPPYYTTEYSTETTTFTSELPLSSENEFQDITSTTEVSTTFNDDITSTPWTSTEESTTADYSESTSEDYTESTSADYSESTTDYNESTSADYSESTTDYSESTSADYSESTTDYYSESTTAVPLIDIRSKDVTTQPSTTKKSQEDTLNPFETDGTAITTNFEEYEDEEDEAEKEKKEIKDDKEKNTAKEVKFQKLQINNAYVCETDGCKQVASHMLNKMNHSGDACEDFYDYACGGDNSDNKDARNLKRIAEKLWQISSSPSTPPYLLAFRKYYESCVKFHYEFNYEQRLKGAKDILHTVSQLYDRTQLLPEAMTLTELLTRLLLVDSAPLFDIAVDADKQSGRFVFQMTPAKRTSLLQAETLMTKAQKQCFQTIRRKFSKNVIDMKPLYHKYLGCLANYTEYLNSIEQAVNAFGDFTHMETYNISWHIQNLRTTIEWYVLPKINIPGEQLSNDDLPPPGQLRHDIVNKKYKVMKVAEMKLQFPLVDWSVLLSRLVGKPVGDEQTVQVYFAEYFKSLFKHLKSLPVWQVHNALLAMFTHDLYNNLVIPVPAENQEDFCLRQSSRLLKEISSAMFMDTWSDKDIALAAKQVDDTFKQIKTNLSATIQAAEWLDDSARIALMMKVSKMQLISQSGATVWTPALLTERMKDVFTESTTNYQDHAIALLKRHRKLLYSLWNENVTDPRNIWWYYATPYSTSPVSIYAVNAIVIPIGMILQTPKNIPRYISLATVGYTVAKEMGRHFDSAGIQYDLKLARDSAASYKAMERCHVDKYSMSMSHQSGSKIYSYEVDPTLSLNEIIVEDFAAKLVSDMSVDVMNDQLMPWIAGSFSREKIFFLAMAQEHCKRSSYEDFFIELFEGDRLPPALLMKSFLGNLNMFTSTFECAEGSGMNHPVKCQQFPEISKEPDYSYLYP